jgi:hypothetical protein
LTLEDDRERWLATIAAQLGKAEMSQRREIEARLALYDDLGGILGAMRSFALAELQRISRREEAQQEVVQVLREALQETAPFQPAREGALADVWLLLGSVRGFCGSFNEDVVRAWQAKADARQPLIVVGERLAATMPEQASLFPVAGADGGLDAVATIDRILCCFRHRPPQPWEDLWSTCLPARRRRRALAAAATTAAGDRRRAVCRR